MAMPSASPARVTIPRVPSSFPSNSRRPGILSNACIKWLMAITSMAHPPLAAIIHSRCQSFGVANFSRPRFSSAFVTSMTPAQFVDGLFANAGVTPSGSDLTAAINEFGGAANTADTAARGRAVRRVAENSILTNTEKNKAFVLMQYLGYLRRDPNAGQ